jgi:membrane protein YdbS with pleckstrin-like domain
MLYWLKIIMLLVGAVAAGWVGYSVIHSLTIEQAAAVYGLAAAMFFLGLFFGMDEYD